MISDGPFSFGNPLTVQRPWPLAMPPISPGHEMGRHQNCGRQRSPLAGVAANLEEIDEFDRILDETIQRLFDVSWKPRSCIADGLAVLVQHSPFD